MNKVIKPKSETAGPAVCKPFTSQGEASLPGYVYNTLKPTAYTGS